MIRAEPQGVGKELWRAIFFLHIAAYRGKSAGQGLLTTFTLGVYIMMPRHHGLGECLATKHGPELWTPVGCCLRWSCSAGPLDWSLFGCFLRRGWNDFRMTDQGLPIICRGPAYLNMAQDTQKLHQCTALETKGWKPQMDEFFHTAPLLELVSLRRERQFYPTGSPLTMGNLDCKIRQRLWSIHHGYWYW